MQLIAFGGLYLSCVDEDVAFPFETMQSNVPLRGGSFDELGVQSFPRSFTITRTFKVVNQLGQLAEVSQEVDALMRVFLAGQHVLKARWKDGSTRQTFAKVVTATRPIRRDDKTYQEMTATWFIQYPYWFASEHEPLYLDHGYFLDTGLYLDGNYSSLVIDSLAETLTIVNGGNAPIERGYLVVRPQSGGSITGLRIQNTNNLQEILFDAVVAYPASLVIDLLSKSVKLDVVNAYDDLVIPAGQMDWLILEVGSNEIALTATAVTGSVDFEWHWADSFV